MKDKAAKKRRQREKRKAKSKAFFERIKCKKSRPQEYFNKRLWLVDKNDKPKDLQPKIIGFNAQAWNIGNSNGR